VDWDFAQENEADDFALKNTLDRNYDVQEVPKLYVAVSQAAAVDQRIGLGFMGNKKRVKERTEYAKKVLETQLKPDYEKKLQAAQLVGTSPGLPVDGGGAEEGLSDLFSHLSHPSNQPPGVILGRGLNLT